MSGVSKPDDKTSMNSISAPIKQPDLIIMTQGSWTGYPGS